jgi:hypothetical protein
VRQLVESRRELLPGQAGDIETARALLLDRERQCGHRPQRTQAEAERTQVALVPGLEAAAIGQHHGGAADELGHDAARAAVAVGARGQGAGQGLLSEVAAEAERIAALVEIPAHGADGDTGLAGDGAAVRIELEHPIEMLERYHACRREEAVVVRVTASDDPHALPVVRRPLDDRGQLVDARRTFNRGTERPERPREVGDALRRARARKTGSELGERCRPEHVRTGGIQTAPAGRAGRSAVPVEAGARRRIAAGQDLPRGHLRGPRPGPRALEPRREPALVAMDLGIDVARRDDPHRQLGVELLETEERRDGRFLRLRVAVPEAEERSRGQGGQPVGLAGDVDHALERRAAAQLQELMGELEIGQVVHLPVQLHALVRGHRLPGDVHPRVQDEEIDGPAVADEAVRERADRGLGSKIERPVLEPSERRTPRAHHHRCPGGGELRREGASDARAAAGDHREPAAQRRRVRRERSGIVEAEDEGRHHRPPIRVE